MKLTVLKRMKYCQNGLWSFARILPKHVPPGNLQNAPRQFLGMSNMVLELLDTV
jgi:hypothetical protein